MQTHSISSYSDLAKYFNNKVKENYQKEYNKTLIYSISTKGEKEIGGGDVVHWLGNNDLSELSGIYFSKEV